MKRHVIVGNSHATLSAIQSLRSTNGTDEITLISKENCPAYSPALTTYYLSGKISYDEMFLCDAGFYRENQVRPILGKAVTKVDPGSKSVSLEDGTSVSYDSLLVATGSTSWLPPIPGTQLPNVFTLWTAEDAQRIADATRDAERVAIVGAGLIGIQSLNAMMATGKQVALVEMLGQVMPQALDPEGAKIVEARLSERGVDLHLNEQVLGIEAHNKRLTLVLASGSQVEAEVVIIAAGVNPNVTLLEGSGVEVSTGAIVNEYCETNIEEVYAAGDVAESVDPLTGELQVNATLLNAAEQGRVAGFNMAGMRMPSLRNIRVNAFTPLDLPCISTGLVSETDERYQAVSQRSGESYRKLIFEEDRLVGAVLIGEVDDAGILASLIERRQSYSGLRKEWQAGKVFLPYASVLAKGI